jgi:hypothetical protein
VVVRFGQRRSSSQVVRENILAITPRTHEAVFAKYGRGVFDVPVVIGVMLMREKSDVGGECDFQKSGRVRSQSG